MATDREPRAGTDAGGERILNLEDACDLAYLEALTDSVPRLMAFKGQPLGALTDEWRKVVKALIRVAQSASAPSGQPDAPSERPVGPDSLDE